MKDFDFILTDDNSVGLYSKIAGDILHSKTGALKESIEKFINPSQISHKLHFHEKINVLDICYGIGYNTKALLSLININKIHIDALETNSKLICLSPFLKDGINNDELKLFLFYQLLQNSYSIDEINSLIYSMLKDNFHYIDEFTSSIFLKIKNSIYKFNHEVDLQAFLHNIYYNYMSNSMEYNPLSNNYKDVSILFHNDDARCSIKNLDKTYDVIFLDAYSPQKDPSLWTINFLNEIKKHMNHNSVLVTYSKSTPVRSALVQLGFFVGKTFINEIDMGTVAALNKNLVPNNLTEFDYALFDSRSGIPFKDESLSLNSSQIIQNRILEQNNSEKISHTALLRQYKH